MNSKNRQSRSKFNSRRRRPSSGGASSNRRKSYSSGPSNRSSRRPGGNGRRSSQGSRGRRKMPSFNPSQFINKNPIESAPDTYKAKHTFKTFGLDPRLSKTIESMGIKTPTPIQDQIIPEILKGRDVIGLAETGTGKTAAFLVPLIEKALHDRKRGALILTPTRELAIQIEDELRKLSKGLGIFSVTCVGGMNIRPQIKALRRKNHFIVGTPGRVLDLINRHELKTNLLTTIVLDEADRMLDMGFIHDMKKILSGVPKDRETLFFSATMSKDAEKIVHDFLNNPVKISAKKKDVASSIEQDVVEFDNSNKFNRLTGLLEKPEFKRVIVFGSMKHSVERLSRELSKIGISAESIHGNKSHSQRQRALKKFKSGNARVLVATDVAARGIHVDDVSHVINYDLPNTLEDYIHRIGRTGRSTKKGKALTFVPKN